MPKQFAFCNMCRLNHDQGRGHRYSVKHKKNVAQALAKFRKRILDVVFFVENPMLLRPEDKQRNRFWCVVCEEEIDEVQSLFACCNAIKHLASVRHMECLKAFWMENGAGVEKRDIYHISQQDFAKWENRCRAIESGATSSGGNCYEDINNIHLKQNCVNMDAFGKVSMITIANNLSDGVVPLQHFKDKRFQVSTQADVGCSVGSVAVQDACLGSSVQMVNAEQQPLSQLAQESNQAQLFSNNRGMCAARVPAGDNLEQKHSLSAAHASSDQGWLNSFSRPEVCNSTRTVKDGYQAYHLTRICTTRLPGEEKANVHTGAPPPWLKLNEGNEAGDIQRLSKTQERKLKKLRNPKRVGAAWAEQRRAELERELKGEVPDKNSASDAAWLPNFGRVWQSGSRRDSRKEFEAEKREFEAEKNVNGEFVTKNEKVVDPQPYISKRMRITSGNGSGKQAAEVQTDNLSSNGVAFM